jgi:EmrB/QacA subfamily drug resistance transporter
MHDASPLSHRQILVVIGGLLAGMSLAGLDQTIVSTSLPTIVGDLGGLEDISWVVTSYLLFETVATPIYGKLSDVYGRPRLFRIAIVVFVVGSMLCGLAQNLWMLVAFRGLQGVGAGGLISMAFATMGDVISPRERGRYTGYFGSVFAVTSVVGPVLGGFLTEHASWRWIFYVNVPVGIVALVVTSRALQGIRVPVRPRAGRFDVAGAALLVLGVSAVLLGLEWGGTEHPWGSPVIVGLLAGGLATLAVWLVWERRAEDPIVPMRLFRHDVVAVAGGMAFLAGVAMFGAITYLPLFLQVVKGVSTSSSGLLILPIMTGVLVSAMVTGRLITRTGRLKFTGPLGFGVITVVTVALATMGTATPLPVIFGAMVVLGLGMGVLSPPLTLAVQNAVDPADIGTATATNMFMRTLGASVGVAVFGAIFSGRITGELADRLPAGSSPDGPVTGLLREPSAIAALPEQVADAVREAAAASLHPVFLVGAVAAVLGVVLSSRLRELPLRSRPAGSALDGPEEEVVEAIAH